MFFQFISIAPENLFFESIKAKTHFLYGLNYHNEGDEKRLAAKKANARRLKGKLRVDDKKAHTKLRKIIKEMLRNNPAEGIGKPEKLKYDLSGYWSRRLTQYHRVVYHFDDNTLYITAIGGYYE